MKASRRKILTLAATITVLFVVTRPMLAIEDLQLTIRCPDVVLSWPSVEGENYIVQWRETLSTNTPWVTLTNYLPAEWGTNITTFTHSNRVECPSEQVLGRTTTEKKAIFQPDYPLVVPGDGSRTPVPLGLYPPGLDLTGYVILWPDGSTNEWSAKLAEEWRTSRAVARGGSGPQPQGIEDGSEPDCGFYRVVRNGLHLFGLTNGTALHGEVEIPIEIGANIAAEDILLLASGDNPAFSEITTNAQGQWVLKWNTQFVPNGEYAIRLEAVERGDTIIQSAVRMVSVTNAVWFNDFMTSFGTQLWFEAELQAANAAYQIAMYDGESGQYLGGFVDATTDGTISFLWDLTDGQGHAFTNESFRADVYLSTNNSPLKKAGTRIFAKETSSVGDSFLVARAEDFNDYRANAYNNYHPAIYNGVVNVVGNPAADDPYTLSPGNIPLGDSTFQFTAESRPEFFSYLTNMNYQNFFWFGHGGPFGLEYHLCDENRKATNGVGMGVTQIAKMLGNGPTIRRHPYRLVFIYGCSAAKGRKWSNAFGIPREATSTAYFQAKGVKARALIANTGITGYFTEESQLFYGESLAVLFNLWMANAPLSFCLYSATNAPSPTDTRRALPTFPDAAWCIQGAQDLRRYNQ